MKFAAIPPRSSGHDPAKVIYQRGTVRSSWWETLFNEEYGRLFAYLSFQLIPVIDDGEPITPLGLERSIFDRFFCEQLGTNPSVNKELAKKASKAPGLPFTINGRVVITSEDVNNCLTKLHPGSPRLAFLTSEELETFIKTTPGGLPNFRELHLDGYTAHLTSADFEKFAQHLSHPEKLEYIYLEQQRSVTDLTPLFNRTKNLKILKLFAFSDSFCNFGGSFGNSLEELWFSDCEGLNENCFLESNFASSTEGNNNNNRLTALKYLRVGAAQKMTPNTLKNLFSLCPNLEKLELSQCPSNNELMAFIASTFPKLKSLRVSYTDKKTGIKSQGVANLVPLAGTLTSLEFEHTQGLKATGGCIDTICDNFTNLTELSVEGVSGLNNDHLKKIGSSLKNLEKLNVAGGDYKCDGIKAILDGCPNLKCITPGNSCGSEINKLIESVPGLEFHLAIEEDDGY